MSKQTDSAPDLPPDILAAAEAFCAKVHDTYFEGERIYGISPQMPDGSCMIGIRWLWSRLLNERKADLERQEIAMRNVRLNAGLDGELIRAQAEQENELRKLRDELTWAHAENSNAIEKCESLEREVAALRSVLSEYDHHDQFTQWHVANQIRDEREGSAK